MIRKAIIVMLTLATIGTGALGVLSFRKDHVAFDPGTQQSWQVYGWHSGGVEVGDRLMLFFDAEVGKFVIVSHAYIHPATVVSPIRFHWGLFALDRIAVSITEEMRERARQRGHSPTSKRVAWKVTIQLWLPAVLFAAYPTIALFRGPLRRRRRRRKGLCLKCGYNLIGNVSGVCSECGEVIQKDWANTGQP